jgi:uncharacterized protein YutE (UPF0331/DUF86 family)
MKIISRINEIKTTIEKLEDWVSSIDENFIYYNLFYTAEGANDAIEIRTKDDRVIATFNIVWNDLTYYNTFLDEIEKETKRLLSEPNNEKQLIELNSIVEMFGCQ